QIHVIAHAERERAPAASLPYTDADDGAGQARHFTQIPGDRFGLPSLFGVDSGVGAGRVKEGDDGAAELGGELHHADRFAVAFRFRHSEIAVQLLLGVAPFLLAHHHDRPAFEESRAAHDGRIVGIQAIAVDFLEIRKDTLDVIERMRALGVTGELYP